MGEMRVLCSLGDERITWDPDSDKSIDMAEERFNELLKDGHKAFRIGGDGKKTGTPIKVFPPHAGRILMIPVSKVVGG